MKNKFAILLLSSCQTKQEITYSDFDTIDWYSIEINPNELHKLRKTADSSDEQRLKFDLLLNDIPEAITDTSFIQKLEKIGFEKQLIKEAKKVNAINQIYREKSNGQLIAMACIAIYRDILIFKKKAKIVGMSKVCLDCWEQQTYGTNENTLSIPKPESYKKLLKILY